ncbi:MAG: hypothetical protein ACRDVE_18035 [Actinocrinis sp.]
MAPEYYVVKRVRATPEAFSVDEARILFAEVSADPRHCVEGDLASGFSFWTFTGDGNKLVRISIDPE